MAKTNLDGTKRKVNSMHAMHAIVQEHADLRQRRARAVNLVDNNTREIERLQAEIKNADKIMTDLEQAEAESHERMLYVMDQNARGVHPDDAKNSFDKKKAELVKAAAETFFESKPTLVVERRPLQAGNERSVLDYSGQWKARNARGA